MNTPKRLVVWRALAELSQKIGYASESACFIAFFRAGLARSGLSMFYNRVTLGRGAAADRHERWSL